VDAGIGSRERGVGRQRHRAERIAERPKDEAQSGNLKLSEMQDLAEI